MTTATTSPVTLLGGRRAYLVWLAALSAYALAVFHRRRKQATEALLGGFTRAYESNRAPFFIGNHFEQWNGGIYMDAVEDALKGMAGKKDVRLVSFRQFVDWLDVQDPDILQKLRSLEVGQEPTGGWNTFLRPATAPSSTPSA